MEQFLFMLPILIVVVVLLTVVVQRLAGAWVEHRVRMSLLRRLEQKPELLDSFEEVQELLHEQPAERAQPRQDFTLTGVLLAAMGLVAVVVASIFDSGRVAVGAGRVRDRPAQSQHHVAEGQGCSRERPAKDCPILRRAAPMHQHRQQKDRHDGRGQEQHRAHVER